MFLLIWLYSFAQTSGLIGNRYANQNAAGELKEDISTGRVELIETELTAFYKHPINRNWCRKRKRI